jgi:hypothetical protein
MFLSSPRVAAEAEIEILGLGSISSHLETCRASASLPNVKPLSQSSIPGPYAYQTTTWESSDLPDWVMGVRGSLVGISTRFGCETAAAKPLKHFAASVILVGSAILRRFAPDGIYGL